MRRLLLCSALIMLVVAGCGNGDDSDSGEIRTAFEVWGVSSTDIPEYTVVHEAETDGGRQLHAEISAEGYDEYKARQMLAEIIEQHRETYDAVEATLTGEEQEFTAVYAVSEEAAEGHGLDMEQANAAGYPLLVFRAD